MTIADSPRKHTPTATIEAEQVPAGATIILRSGMMVQVKRNEACRPHHRRLSFENQTSVVQVPTHAPITIYVKKEG